MWLIKCLPLKFNVMFKFNYSKYNPPGLIFGGGGGLYMEGVFHFNSWFLNALGLIHGGAYYQNFTVPVLMAEYYLGQVFVEA